MQENVTSTLICLHNKDVMLEIQKCAYHGYYLEIAAGNICNDLIFFTVFSVQVVADL